MCFLLLLLLSIASKELSGDVVPSSFTCTETASLIERRCLFRNVYVVGKALWVVSNSSVELPQVLCTAVDRAASRTCSIEWHTPEEVSTRLKNLPVEMYDTGVLFSRLNPTNMYHALFENYLPIFELLASTPEFAHWLAPTPAASQSKVLAFQDDVPQFGPQLTATYGRILFPDVRLVERPDLARAFRINLLVAGTRASCVHVGHCSRGQFLTPDIGTQFRKFLLGRLGLEPSRPQGGPRVTIVQRSIVRMIANVEDLFSKVNSVLTAHLSGSAPQVKEVDFGLMPVRDQVAVTMNTDVLILVHGGALGNVAFLPPHAVVIDIYPYAFYPQLHGYIVNGIRLAMPSMHYGHRCVETTDSSTIVLMDKKCLPPSCAAVNTTPPFFVTRCIYMDVEAFAVHFNMVLQAWCHAVWSADPRPEAGCPGSLAAAQEVYAAPPSAAEFNAKTDQFALRFSGKRDSCDQRVKCNITMRKRFRPYRQCKLR
eukprot:EG_transcript_10638